MQLIHDVYWILVGVAQTISLVTSEWLHSSCIVPVWCKRLSLVNNISALLRVLRVFSVCWHLSLLKIFSLIQSYQHGIEMIELEGLNILVCELETNKLWLYRLQCLLLSTISRVKCHTGVEVQYIPVSPHLCQLFDSQLTIEKMFVSFLVHIGNLFSPPYFKTGVEKCKQMKFLKPIQHIRMN